MIMMVTHLKVMAGQLGLSKDYIMDDVKDFVKEITLDNKMVCLRQSEAQLVTILVLFLGKIQQ